MRSPLTATLLAAALLFPAAALAQETPPATEETSAAALEAETDNLLYALGLALGSNISSFRFTPEETAKIQVGFLDGVLQADPKVDMNVYGAKLQQYMMGRTNELRFREEREGAEYCEQEAAKEGAVRTETGMIYFETEAGTGASPAANDRVLIHYHGTLRDGTVFDSSMDRGEPVAFNLNEVIPCFSEGVQRMKVGGKSRLVCPSKLAYGDNGSAPLIAPGATLVFKIELIEIVTEAAATPPPPPPAE